MNDDRVEDVFEATVGHMETSDQAVQGIAKAPIQDENNMKEVAQFAITQMIRYVSDVASSMSVLVPPLSSPPSSGD